MARGREWPGLIAWFERFEKAVPADAVLYCDQPGLRRAAAVHLRASGVRTAGANRPERIEQLIALMRRKAADGREVLYLSQQTFENPAASGLVPLGSYPLRSTMLNTARRGVPTGTKPRGADFVLYRVQPS